MISCDYPGCTAKYRRREHLTRHARKHFPAAQILTCEVCNKAFDRTDSLRRHRQVHLRDQGADIVPRASRACDRCHTSKTRCDGHEPCNVCSRRGVACTYNRLAKRAVTGDSGPCPAPATQTGSVSDDGQNSQQHDLNETYDWITNDTSMGGGSDLPQNSDHRWLNETTSLSRSEIQDLIIHHENQLRAKGFFGTCGAEPLTGEPPYCGRISDLDTDHYLEVYFAHFHYQWPMLHGRLFLLSKEPRILYLAVVMIGLWVTGESAAQARAETMHEKLLTLLENRMHHWILDSEFKDTSWPMTSYQAIILNIIFAIIRDVRSDIYERCRLMLHAVTTACITGGIFSYKKVRSLIAPTDSVRFSWTYAEEIKRLALAIFKLNMHFNTGMLTVFDLQFPLPDGGYLWDAPESKEFYRRYHSQLESGTSVENRPLICDIVRDMQEGRKGPSLLLQGDPLLGFVVSQYLRPASGLCSV
ncbi:hypothetical protein BJX76DRAFT_332931 [Aspergillus varians]